jgi:hypothetical protein
MTVTVNYATLAEVEGLQLTLAEVLVAVNKLVIQGAKLMSSNAQFVTDVAALTTAVGLNTLVLQNLETLVAADTTNIATMNAEIATLQAANPVLDLSALENATNALAANNTSAAGVLSSNPASPAVPPPPGGAPIPVVPVVASTP